MLDQHAQAELNVRLYDDKHSSLVSPFVEDRSRLIKSMSFMRLEYKTQVFINHFGDHYRTRLTHSLEVADIAKQICSNLGLKQELAEVIALAHDIGHPPFGHAGEESLKLVAQDYGGFDHNVHSIRVLTELETLSTACNGLNLTVYVIDGIAKHNGALSKSSTVLTECTELQRLYNSSYGIGLSSNPSLEAQVASISDDIAYCTHDIEDGYRAGMLSVDDMCSIDELAEILGQVRKERVYKDEIRGTVIALRTLMMLDVIETTRERCYDVASAEEIYSHDGFIVGFSDEMQDLCSRIKGLLYSKIYSHYLINRINIKAKGLLAKMFNRLMGDHTCLPPEWQEKITEGDSQKARIIVDYLAGMTDRYAIEEYNKLFDLHHF